MMTFREWQSRQDPAKPPDEEAAWNAGQRYCGHEEELERLRMAKGIASHCHEPGHFDSAVIHMCARCHEEEMATLRKIIAVADESLAQKRDALRQCQEALRKVEQYMDNYRSYSEPVTAALAAAKKTLDKEE